MFIIDNFEHECEQGDTDLVKIIQIKAHVEGLGEGQVLQEIKISLKCRILEIKYSFFIIKLLLFNYKAVALFTKGGNNNFRKTKKKRIFPLDL